MTIKILDCTLRDGGYYNKWDFNDRLVREYLKLIDVLKIDYVEIGFRKIDREKKFGKFFSITDRDIGKLTNNRNFKISVMIDLADFKKDLKINELFKKKIYTNIDLVRIAVSFEDLKYLSKIIIELNLLGYKVAVNLMKFTSLNPKQIYNFFNQLDSKLIDYYYLADSYGNCNPKFIENLSYNNLLKHYRTNDIFILPSLLEGFGLVITEAMSNGMVVMSTNRTGLPEIRNDNDSILIKVNNAKDIVHKVTYLIKRPKQIQRMGKNALITASKYSWPKYQNKLVEIINDNL